MEGLESKRALRKAVLIKKGSCINDTAGNERKHSNIERSKAALKLPSICVFLQVISDICNTRKRYD